MVKRTGPDPSARLKATIVRGSCHQRGGREECHAVLVRVGQCCEVAVVGCRISHREQASRVLQPIKHHRFRLLPGRWRGGQPCKPLLPAEGASSPPPPCVWRGGMGRPPPGACRSHSSMMMARRPRAARPRRRIAPVRGVCGSRRGCLAGGRGGGGTWLYHHHHR